MEAYKKQNNIPPNEDLSKFKINMSSHLIPNKAHCRTQNPANDISRELLMAQTDVSQNSAQPGLNQGRS